MLQEVKSFSDDFKDYIWSDEVLAVIPDFGWIDGGCRSLMKALQIWLGEENVKTYQITQSKEHLHSEHALIKVGEYFLDGNGVSEYSELYRYWIEEEGFTAVYINEFEPKNEPNSLSGEEPCYIDEASINQLVSLLKNKFNKNHILKLLQS